MGKVEDTDEKARFRKRVNAEEKLKRSEKKRTASTVGRQAISFLVYTST